eukprot:Blabericola_migrator_1__9156@NODE_48_length_16467_cov_53_390427_g44_i0_p16_GENE_NODE_48_length_16467_cov_53_390427_g44_i0NODE_48_length_16467_cov_53_390427_g44_i0_p16_ORF_typecomplete_len109_score7_27_NODE_48_length_16467_cov_53_390427_g44_i01304813374
MRTGGASCDCIVGARTVGPGGRLPLLKLSSVLLSTLGNIAVMFSRPLSCPLKSEWEFSWSLKPPYIVPVKFLLETLVSVLVRPLEGAPKIRLPSLQYLFEDIPKSLRQ